MPERSVGGERGGSGWVAVEGPLRRTPEDGSASESVWPWHEPLPWRLLQQPPQPQRLPRDSTPVTSPGPPQESRAPLPRKPGPPTVAGWGTWHWVGLSASEAPDSSAPGLLHCSEGRGWRWEEPTERSRVRGDWWCRRHCWGGSWGT